jgi:tetratricopeptide (TPR) repeat protein
MLYVAVTRAREYICFYEDEDDLTLYEEIQEHIQNINTFNENELKFDYISDDDDYFKEGQYLESKEKYEQAIFQYKKSKSKNISHCIKRCEALLLKEKGKYSEAGAKLLKLKEYILASECYIEVENYTKLLKCYVLSNKTYESIVSEFKELGVDPVQIAFQKDTKELWTKQFYHLYENHIETKINKNKQNIDYINETLKILKKRYEN